MDILDLIDEPNIVKRIPDRDSEAYNALRLFEEAEQSMAQWKKKYKKALWLARLQPNAGNIEIDHKTFPFDGASLAMLPFILEAMLDFQSRATPDLVWARNIVKFKVYGKPSDDKTAREKRLAEFSNHQLAEDIPNWRDDQDKALLILPCVGTIYKKTFWDGDTVASELVLAEEVIFNHEHKSFRVAPDKFQRCKYTKNEVVGYIRGEHQWDMEESDLDEDQDEFEFIEAYTWMDLDEDGLKEPYHVIIYEEKIVYASAEYDEDDISYNEDQIVKIKENQRFTQYRFIPDPAGGPMGLGWGILLGPMFDAINTNLRQLIDGGTLQNTASNSGLIAIDTHSGRGNSIQSGPVDVKLGQLTPITMRGMTGSLSQNVVQFPFQGPSEGLFRLMQYLATSARELTTAALRVEAIPNEAASLYLARLTQGLKIPNAIIMRVYASFSEECGRIKALNFKHYDDDKYNRVLDEERSFRMSVDFNPDDCDIKIAHDPTQGSDIERSARADAILEKAVTQPAQILNLRQAYLDWLEAVGAANPEQLAPEPQGPDPMQEMMVRQAAMDAEFEDRRIKNKERELALSEWKVQLQAAKDLEQLGLATDEMESKITLNYANSLKAIISSSDASIQKSMSVMAELEEKIDNTGPTGTMAGAPGNQGA